MEAGFLGTSNPAQSIQLSLLFDLKTNPMFCAGILHWCATGIGLCCAALPHKHVFHMPHLRFRETKRVKEPWVQVDIREAAKALQTAAGHGARDCESV